MCTQRGALSQDDVTAKNSVSALLFAALTAQGRRKVLDGVEGHGAGRRHAGAAKAQDVHANLRDVTRHANTAGRGRTPRPEVSHPLTGVGTVMSASSLRTHQPASRLLFRDSIPVLIVGRRD
jgi:hypothetical protein